MKTTILKLFAITLITAFATTANAQSDYKTGIGLRGGYPSGITLKHFISGNAAIEGVLSGGWGSIGVTGLYQIHKNFPDVPNLKWYYGGGAHLAITNANRVNPWTGTSGGTLQMGLDGVVGLEYVIPDIPISLSIDLLPIVNVFQDIGVWYNAGISVRYTIK